MSGKKAKKTEVQSTIKQANKILLKEGLQYQGGKFFKVRDSREKPISNFIIIPIRKIVRNDNDGEKHFIELKAIVDNKETNTYLVEASEVEKAYFLNRCWGGCCNLYPDGGGYKLIKFALKLLLRKVEEVHQYTEIGWQCDPDGRKVYVTGDTVIGSVDDNYLIHEDIHKYVINRNEFSEKKAYKRFMKLFDVADDRIMYPLIAHTMTGVMFQLYQESSHEIESGLFLSGTTGSLKTTLAFLTSNLFRKLEGGEKLHGSCFDTINDLESFIHSVSSSVCIVDDLHPSVDPYEARNLEGKVQRLVRNIGDGKGKGRLSKDLSRQAKYEPRSSVLFTGEFGISGESSLARLYTVNMTRSDINFESLSEVQLDEVALSTCMFNFIKWMSKYYDDIVGHLSDNFIKKRGQIVNELECKSFHPRKPKTIVCYLLGLEVFFDYGVMVGALSEKKKDKMLKVAKNEFINGILDQHQDNKQYEPAYMFLRTLNDLIATNKAIIAPIGKIMKDRRLIGYESENHLYLLPGASYNHVCAFLRTRNQVFPLTPQKLSETLFNYGLTDVDQSEGSLKYHKKKVLYGNKRQRVLNINKEAMARYLGEEERQKKKKKGKKKKPESIIKFESEEARRKFYAR